MYTPLYIKTENSLLESIIKIDDLIEFAKSNNIKSLTITDNKMYGVYYFYKKCLENNIKPIVGLEVCLDEKKIVLYAKNYDGYKNLLKLTTLEVITLDDLNKYNSDLICILPFESKDLNVKFETVFIGFKNEVEKSKIDSLNKLFMNEILCLKKDDQVYLKYVESIRKNIPVKDIDDKDFNYLKLDVDMLNNNKIYEMCNLVIPCNKNLLPIYKTPNNIESSEYLKQLCIAGLKRIFGESTKKIYIDRLKYELDIIKKMGFCNYFLIVWDYVMYAKDNKILVGPGRGSAAGSLVSYTLGITTIDPIKYNLLFERFLNPERITMPDIDIDFEYTRRDEVVDYCIKKYGLKCVAPIITFGTLGAKQSIRDVGKSLEIPLKTIDKLCSEIDSNISLKDNYNKSKKIQEMLEIDKSLIELYKVANHIEGLKRHTSIHAAGIVMSSIPLDMVIPLDKSHEFYTTGYSMEFLEEQGLLKMDFLALKNLTLINDILKEVNVDFDSIPNDDRDTLNLFCEGKTSGIFQFESSGMMNFLKKFKPNNFDEIYAALALYRPGPMNNIDTYIRRKMKIEKIDYILSVLEPILKSTYGVIIYQEQIMEIAKTLAGYSLGEADVLRRAMSKKKENVLLNEKDKFIKRCVERGYDELKSRKVYELILKFALYGFNKAHSVSYATISYRMGYLKVRYKEVFMKWLLNNNIGSEVKIKEYIYECKSMGLNILKPDINRSGKEFEIVDNNLIFPLTAIKGLGILTVEKILESRITPFKDIFDFVKRCSNKAILDELIYSGCFDNLNYNKRTLIDNLDKIINYSELEIDDSSLVPIIDVKEEYDLSFVLEKELELFGFYLSNHPITKYKACYNSIDIKDVPNFFDKFVNIVVYVDRIKVLNTKKNELMCFMDVSDEIDSIDVVFFPRVYDDSIEKHDILYLNVKVEKRFDKYQLIVNDVLEKIKL